MADSPLSFDEIERLNRPVEQAVGLPGRAYSDPRFFDHERDLIFGRQWVCVGVTADVAEPGDLFPVELAGIPILIARGRDGEIRAFHNICRHRGATLVEQKCSGKGAIVCPYHAWTYGLDGQLRKTPHLCGAGVHEHESFDRSAHGLLPIRCETWASLIFVNLDRNARPLLEDIAPLRERWSMFDFDLLRHDRGLRFELNANWKLAIENFVERYHLPWVHPELNSFSGIQHSFDVVESDRFVGVGSRSFRPTGMEGLPRFPNLPAERETMGEYLCLFPSLLLGIHADHMYAFIITPVAPDRTLERFEFFFVGDEAMNPELAPARNRRIDLLQIINGEDIGIVERLHRGSRSPAMAGSVFSPTMERTTHRFQRMVADCLQNRVAQIAAE